MALRGVGSGNHAIALQHAHASSQFMSHIIFAFCRTCGGTSRDPRRSCYSSEPSASNTQELKAVNIANPRGLQVCNPIVQKW
jgi:hypothetical protein